MKLCSLSISSLFQLHAYIVRLFMLDFAYPMLIPSSIGRLNTRRSFRQAGKGRNEIEMLGTWEERQVVAEMLRPSWLGPQYHPFCLSPQVRLCLPC